MITFGLEKRRVWRGVTRTPWRKLAVAREVPSRKSAGSGYSWPTNSNMAEGSIAALSAISESRKVVDPNLPSLASRLAARRARRIEQRLKNFEQRERNASGASTSSATVVPFDGKRRRALLSESARTAHVIARSLPPWLRTSTTSRSRGSMRMRSRSCARAARRRPGKIHCRPLHAHRARCAPELRAGSRVLPRCWRLPRVRCPKWFVTKQ